MRQLSAEGLDRVASIARNFGASTDGALTLLDALMRGGGTMAQFSHPDFGGAGQWMQGGMTMVSDLFNNALKSKVDGLCWELSNLLRGQSDWLWAPLPPAQQQQQSGSGFGGGYSLSGGTGGSYGGNWWPGDLGSPNSSGSQNDLRYAYFSYSRRLAVDLGGKVTVYDTLDHNISGVSQQQGNGWNLTFTSQYGVVPVSSLPIVSGAAEPPPAPVVQAPVYQAPVYQALAPAGNSDVISQSDLAGSQWQFEGYGLLTLGAEGAVLGNAYQRAAYWSVEDGVLWFYDQSGRSSARFGWLGWDGGDRVLRGNDPAQTQQVFVLRGTVGRNDAPSNFAAPQTAGLPVDMSIGDWTLEDAGGFILATLKFQPDGRIQGGRASEAGWRVDGDTLVVLHSSGRPTARFDTFQFRAKRWSVSGPLLANEQIVQTLRQR